MTKRKSASKATTTRAEEREQREAEARGEGDLVYLTNDSGEVKKLSKEDWEEQKVILLDEGWRELGKET